MAGMSVGLPQVGLSGADFGWRVRMKDPAWGKTEGGEEAEGAEGGWETAGLAACLCVSVLPCWIELLGSLLQAVISLLGARIRILLLLGQWVTCKALGNPHSPVSQHGLASLHGTGGEAGH